MIQSVSDVSDLPPQILEEYRKKGWSDEEILENFSDAIDFINSRIRCCALDEAVSLAWIFSH